MKLKFQIVPRKLIKFNDCSIARFDRNTWKYQSNRRAFADHHRMSAVATICLNTSKRKMFRIREPPSSVSPSDAYTCENSLTIYEHFSPLEVICEKTFLRIMASRTRGSDNLKICTYNCRLYSYFCRQGNIHVVRE